MRDHVASSSAPPSRLTSIARRSHPSSIPAHGFVHRYREARRVRLVYAFGPLPALIAAFLFTGGMRAIPVVLDGTAGLPVIAGTTLTLVVLSLGYIAALRRPPGAQVLVAAIGLTIFMQLLSPVLFSADIYAYAFYGDEALHGLNPYAYDPGTMNDPLSAIAKHAWNGSIPRCVYGPVAVLLAAIADVAGAPGWPAAQIALQRVVAVAAFAACVALVFRIFPDARARVAIALNPVVIAAVVEGHNDAAMLALLLAACAWPQAKRRFFILATLVKAPALFFIAALRRDALTWAALAVVCIGYLPLLWGVLGHAASHGTPADWDSPLGVLALATGSPAVAELGLIALAASAYFVRRLRGAERSVAFAFVLWYLLPNAYPWYALWIVPLA